MLEQLFAAPNTGSRPPIQAPARKQTSPLEAFLRNQQFGSRIAGNTPAGTHTVASNAPAPFSPESTGMGNVVATPGAVDPAAITSFYADPANSDYHNDPGLLAANAADNTTRGNADSAALKARRQLLAQFGSHDLASSVLGADDPTMGAISDNPDTSTSMLARLARSYRDTVSGNEDARNKGNLWYSSARAEGLNNDARDYATLQADAGANAQQGLDQISSNLANVKSGASQADATAEGDAFSRYLAAIAAHPPNATPGAGGPTQLTGSPPTDLGSLFGTGSDTLAPPASPVGSLFGSGADTLAPPATPIGSLFGVAPKKTPLNTYLGPH